MTYEVFVYGGASIEVTERQFKHLTSEVHIKDKQFIVYDEFDNIAGIIFNQHITLIKVKP